MSSVDLERLMERAREENLRVLSGALTDSILARSRYEKFGLSHHVQIMNTAQFAFLWNLDLHHLLRELDGFQNRRGYAEDWQRMLHVRLLAMTMYECCEDFQALLGKPLRAALTALKAEPALIAELNSLGSQLTNFWDNNRVELKALRNTIVAHRDHDARVQLKALRSARVKEIRDGGWQMLSWTTDLIIWLNKALAFADAGATQLKSEKIT
jgi:hypothetical protein